MATAKKSTPAKSSTPAKTGAAKKPTSTTLKPITSAFNKTSLTAHLAQTTGVDVKEVKAVLAGLEATMLASLHKKGLGEFTLPGLIKVTAVPVPAKKKRTGINPFTKQEQVFAAKPATTKLRLRALKKVKDAAI
ncbi:HU family DNA-binding protein [Aquincola sp. J276]|nr:HU family DNA-binding protein [Aquincola sp. J276]MCR5868146.1 HU family DNA-binding protein [Aquincola sp. J276]